MAICKPSPLIGSITGSLGTLTFKITRRGTVVATRRRLTNPKSSPQLASDVRFATLVSAWRDISGSQRQAWRSYARNIPKVDRLGITRTWSGFPLFIRHNTPAYSLGLPLISDPPPLTILPALFQVRSFFFVSAEYGVVVNIQAPRSPVYLITEGCATFRTNTNVEIKVDPPLPTWPFKRWRTVDTTSLATGNHTHHITASWKAQLGILTQGQWAATRTRLWHPDALDGPRTITSYVTGP